MILFLSFMLGIVAGLRAMIPLAAVSWSAKLGYISLSGSWLAFLGYSWTPWILTLLALAELLTDQLPTTPSRTVPQQFGARLVTGGVSGGALGIAAGSLVICLIAGLIGAVVGTLGGARARGWLAASLGSDRPAALIEDAAAIALAVFAVTQL